MHRKSFFGGQGCGASVPPSPQAEWVVVGCKLPFEKKAGSRSRKYKILHSGNMIKIEGTVVRASNVKVDVGICPCAFTGEDTNN